MAEQNDVERLKKRFEEVKTGSDVLEAEEENGTTRLKLTGQKKEEKENGKQPELISEFAQRLEIEKLDNVLKSDFMKDLRERSPVLYSKLVRNTVLRNEEVTARQTMFDQIINNEKARRDLSPKDALGRPTYQSPPETIQMLDRLKNEIQNFHAGTDIEQRAEREVGRQLVTLGRGENAVALTPQEFEELLRNPDKLAARVNQLEAQGAPEEAIRNLANIATNEIIMGAQGVVDRPFVADQAPATQAPEARSEAIRAEQIGTQPSAVGNVIENIKDMLRGTPGGPLRSAAETVQGAARRFRSAQARRLS